MATQLFSQAQRHTLQQKMRLSARQIQTLGYLAMSGDDLLQELERLAEQNPALELDFGGAEFLRPQSAVSSDEFNAALENSGDFRQPLAEHFERQLPFLRLSESEEKIARDLLGNLDEKGRNILSPATFGAPVGLLVRLRALDPAGCFVASYEESLFVQALERYDEAPRGAFHVLNGNFAFLEGMNDGRTAARLNSYIAKEGGRSFGASEFEEGRRCALLKAECAERFPVPFYLLPKISGQIQAEEIPAILNFIRKLTPNPAANYSVRQTHFVSPDIRIERTEGGAEFKAVNLKEFGGRVRISRKFMEMAARNSGSEFFQKSLDSAQQLLDSLKFRDSSILAAARELASVQKEFFESGPGHLNPFLQKDLAQRLGVHCSTICRLAQSKYVLCDWGLFPLKYFFSGGVDGGSRDKALRMIQEIVRESPSARLSDQKICALLAARGIRISRRTVAKYRSQLNIGSSYAR